jgi:surface protein
MTYNSLAELFTAIANSIRGKTGGTEKIVANDFPAAIDGISSGGGDDWYITDAQYLCYNGARQDVAQKLVGKFKNITDMKYMLYKCSKLAELDVSNVDTSNVTDMSYTFSNCTRIKGLNVGNWNTNKVSNMRNMFSGCSEVAALDISNFGTGNVTLMTQMFSGCSSLASPINMSSWDTSKVTDMWNMFDSCLRLTEIIGFSATNKAGMTIGFPCGSGASTRQALKRLTFRTDLPDGVYSIRSAINIKYCSFERDGMVEMFNTLPDVSGMGLSSSYTTITITGNPCVTNATLTAEDEAIATAKGWTLVK